MAYVITKGMQVRVGSEDKDVRIPITTTAQVRDYNRVKVLRPHRFLFGTVEGIHEVEREVLRPKVDPDTEEPLADDDGNQLMEVVRPAKFNAIVKWAGPKYRTSILPVEMLVPAVKEERAEII